MRVRCAGAVTREADRPNPCSRSAAAGMIRKITAMDDDSEDLQNPQPVFIAGKLRHARRAEHLLSSSGVDYKVRVEHYGRSMLFGTVRYGAVFYVEAERAEHCRELLTRAGLGKGVVENDVATER